MIRDTLNLGDFGSAQNDTTTTTIDCECEPLANRESDGKSRSARGFSVTDCGEEK